MKAALILPSMIFICRHSIDFRACGEKFHSLDVFVVIRTDRFDPLCENLSLKFDVQIHNRDVHNSNVLNN